MAVASALRPSVCISKYIVEYGGCRDLLLMNQIDRKWICCLAAIALHVLCSR